jgi:hypothetical protein
MNNWTHSMLHIGEEKGQPIYIDSWDKDYPSMIKIQTNTVSDLKRYFPINDNNSRFDLVEIKTTHTKVAPTPHCKIHGAMNCVAIHKNGKLWRCIQSCQLKDCRAGCEEKYE